MITTKELNQIILEFESLMAKASKVLRDVYRLRDRQIGVTPKLTLIDTQTHTLKAYPLTWRSRNRVLGRKR